MTACALTGAAAVSIPALAQAATEPLLSTGACPEGTVATVECGTLSVPRDYDKPNGSKFNLAIAKSPATDPSRRLGTLFFNYGGPSGPAAVYVRAFGADLFGPLNDRYDIVGVDPRGVGESTPVIDCKANQETEGIYSQPFIDDVFAPFDFGALIRKDNRYISKCTSNNREVLNHVSTANVARDFNSVRQALGEQKINYLGYSYGTYIGATFAKLFPNRYNRMVLDGPVDATVYANRPLQDLAEQSTGFEKSLDRFFQACARDQVACAGFPSSEGDSAGDPEDAYDELIKRADANPLPSSGPDTRPVDGDDINFATAGELYAKFLWPELARALAAAEKGDGTLFRQLTDGAYGLQDDGTYAPGNDQYFTIGAVDQNYPKQVPGPYLQAGDQSIAQHPHFNWNNGFVELNYGLYPVRDKDVFRGPFRLKPDQPTPLVIATTYDPATPFAGAKRLVRDLGNARLLVMRGDNHTAYPGNSPACIDPKVEAFFDTGVLPAPGTTCKQDLPFAQPETTPLVASRQAAPDKTGQASKPAVVVKGPRTRVIGG